MAEIDPNFNESELAHDQEYQPELAHDQEYQPELSHDHEQEYQPELADDHEQEYQPELTHDHTQEYQPELAHDQEQEYQPELADDHAQEYQPELLAHDQEEVAQEHEPADGIPEILHPDEKEGHADEPVSGGGEKWPGWPGESLFRMLVPAQKVGSIIGRKGEYIKRTCEETKARIKILDGPPGMRERAVMVSAKEEPDMPIPPAINGLLSIHKQAVDGLDNDSSHPPPGVGGKVSTRLLLPASQAGNLIGKQGSTVKSIQEESNCIVRVLGAEELPIFALQDDRIVEVVGEPTGTHKAIELIACHLRKFLVDRSIIPVIEMQMQMPNPKMEHMPPSQSWGPPPPQSFPPPAHSGPGYGASLDFVRPPRQYDSYYPPSDMPQPPPPETQHHQGISAYGRETSMSSSSQAATSVITQVTQKMQIPLAYADGVIGTQGANISYTRRVSGATVTIQETRGVPGEMTVEISGTSSQVQTAQQLIQNFIAEAAAPSQAQQHAPPADHAYNSYGGQGSVYGSAASNPNIGSQGGGYGSVYGASYGY